MRAPHNRASGGDVGSTTKRPSNGTMQTNNGRGWKGATTHGVDVSHSPHNRGILFRRHLHACLESALPQQQGGDLP